MRRLALILPTLALSLSILTLGCGPNLSIRWEVSCTSNQASEYLDCMKGADEKTKYACKVLCGLEPIVHHREKDGAGVTSISYTVACSDATDPADIEI